MPQDWIMGLAGGLLIGLAAAIYLLASGRIMGASGQLGEIVDGSAGTSRNEKLSFLAGLIVVPGVAVLLIGGADTRLSASPWVIVLAGLCVGLGTRLANGCTSGHGVCGISRLSPRGIIATLIYIGAGAATVLAIGRGVGGMTVRDRVAFLTGALFGLGLLISRMTDTQKVQGFLDLFGDWDPTLVFVMGGAILPMAVAWRLTTRRVPLLGGAFPDRPPVIIDRRLVIGSVLFGVGWGLVGLCPGPAIASLGWGGTGGLLFFAAMALAMAVQPRLATWLDAKSEAA